MVKFAKYNKSGVPLLEEDSYPTWKSRMKFYLQSTDYKLWDIISGGYVVPTNIPIDEAGLKPFQLNLKAIDMLHGALDEKAFDMIDGLGTTKEIWDKLEQRYEGTNKSKELRLESLMEQLHQLKMRTDEDIRGYQDRVEALVNKIRSLGKKDDPADDWVAKRVLRTVIRKFEPKVSVLEEREDPPSAEQVFDILYHFETKLNQEDEPSTKEATFKSISKQDEASTSKQKGKTHFFSNLDDEELQNFLTQTLPQGSGKYKGKFPLKCFSCGKIGHYAKICPYAKNVENKNRNSSRKNGKFRNKSHKKSLLANDYDSSDESGDSSDNDSNSESDDESEPEKLMFMAMNSTKAPERIISEDEGDLTEQLTNYQNELGRISLKCKTLKEENKDLIRERRNFELQLEVSRRDNERLLQ